MLHPSALRGFRPLIATPAYGDNVATNYVKSMINFTNACRDKAMSFAVNFDHDSLITRCRNVCVAKFLADPRLTHLFWIDADVGFSPEAAFRLLLADRDVVAGVYPLKMEVLSEEKLALGMTREEFEIWRTRYPVGTGSETVFDMVIDSDGFMELAEVANGFLLIKRSVFELLMQRYPELHCVPEHSLGRAADDFYYRFFDVIVDPSTQNHS
jgi:hypothetical protein